MTEDSKKALPKEFESDHSLPGRYEESNSGYFEEEIPRSKSRWSLVFVLSFVILLSGVFSYYYLNQPDIDSRIIQNTINLDPEQRLADQYGIGEYGSDHDHAAIAVFVYGEQLNFGLQQFQLSSKFIHFENHNPYLLHKHATDVPLQMLFESIGMEITSDCILFDYEETDKTKTDMFCQDKNNNLVFYINGERYYSDISQYVINHNDRILISFGDGKSLSKQLEYVKSLKIFDIPKKIPQFSKENINV